MWTTVEQVHDLFVVAFFLFEVYKNQQISVNGFYTSKQTTIKKEIFIFCRREGLLVVCVCVFWVQRSKGHDCVRTLASTTSSSKAQMRHS